MLKSTTLLERTVTLFPLPKQLRLPEIVIRTDNHWTTAACYIHNLTFARLENLFYAIGFSTVFDHEIEAAVIKYQNKYYSPMLADSVTLPFRVAFEMDAISMFDFYEQHYRAPVYSDYINGLVTHELTI